MLLTHTSFFYVCEVCVSNFVGVSKREKIPKREKKWPKMVILSRILLFFWVFPPFYPLSAPFWGWDVVFCVGMLSKLRRRREKKEMKWQPTTLRATTTRPNFAKLRKKWIKNIKLASQRMRIMDLDQYLKKMNTITEFIWIQFWSSNSKFHPHFVKF